MNTEKKLVAVEMDALRRSCRNQEYREEYFHQGNDENKQNHNKWYKKNNNILVWSC